jgi:uncharacterized protein
MEIRNLTRKKTLAKDFKICNSLWSKAKGLMFCRKRSLVMVFDRDELVPLHMLFVFFPIDVLYLDSSRKVLEIKKGFRPFTFHTPKKRARYVVEIPSPSGGISEEGDKIAF